MAFRGARSSRVRVLHPQEEKRRREHLKRLAAEREERRAKSEEAARLTATIQPRVADTLAAEIRSHWQKASPKGKSVSSDMMSAVRADPRTSSAILGAPPYLSGLKDHDLVRGAAIDAHAPEQKAALDEAKRALDKITAARDRSMSVLGSRIALWKDPQPTAIRQLREIADA